MSVYTSTEKELCCPLCGDVFTHVDQVQVAGRPDGEDGPIIEVEVNAGGVVSDATTSVPAGAQVGAGRRHRISLLGWCEMCEGRFALVFTQHKGVTFVESVDLTTDAQGAVLPSPRGEQEPATAGEEVA